MSGYPRTLKRVKLSRSNPDFSEILYLLVGAKPNQKRFTLHYDIISKRMDLADGIIGAAILMEKWEPEIFSHYLRCVYCNCVHGSATFPISNASSSKEALQDDGNAIETLFGTLVKVYLIANEARDLYTANIVRNEIINLAKRTREDPGANAIILAYASLDTLTYYASCSAISMSMTAPLSLRLAKSLDNSSKA